MKLNYKDVEKYFLKHKSHIFFFLLKDLGYTLFMQDKKTDWRKVAKWHEVISLKGKFVQTSSLGFTYLKDCKLKLKKNES